MVMSMEISDNKCDLSKIYLHPYTMTEWQFKCEKKIINDKEWLSRHIILTNKPTNINKIKVIRIFIIKDENNNIIHSQYAGLPFSKTNEWRGNDKFILWDCVKNIKSLKMECYLYFEFINDQPLYTFNIPS